MSLTVRDARSAALALLALRSNEAAVWPSEVAKRLVAAPEAEPAAHWRDAMPFVHDAVDRVVRDGQVRLSWKGKALKERAGPYRIGRGQMRDNS